jgi:glucose/arabinose dehydrogenase
LQPETSQRVPADASNATAHYRLRVRCHVFAPENTNLSSASRPSTDWRSVALKGSWNRSVPTGYKVVRVPFKDGRPEGYYENFATGFWVSGEQRAEVWGRPAALAVAKDGSLLVADDTGGTIWRISYKGPPAEHAAAPEAKTP